MKCPKCGYLGFETVDRCRNCGYDFSLAPSGVERLASGEVERRASSNVEEAEPSNVDDEMGREPEEREPIASSRLEGLTPERQIADLTLHDTPPSGHALADIDLGNKATPSAMPADPIVIHGKSNLDLDRLIGAPEQESPRPDPVLNTPRPQSVSDDHTPLLDAVEAEAEAANLPLFGRARLDHGAEEPPIVAAPRPAGPPLAVRRATPEVARPRNRSPRTTRPFEQPLSFPSDAPASKRAAARDTEAPQAEETPFQLAPRVSRLAAALIDVGLLAGICVGVLYLTLRIANLTFDDVRVLPVVPMAAFLVLLVAGYSIAFTAAGGQTIGKMATGIKVIGEDGRPVDVSSAVLRLAGNAVNIATLGLAWLPALFAADGRSLADRLAGTRVVRA